MTRRVVVEGEGMEARSRLRVQLGAGATTSDVKTVRDGIAALRRPSPDAIVTAAESTAAAILSAAGLPAELGGVYAVSADGWRKLDPADLAAGPSPGVLFTRHPALTPAYATRAEGRAVELLQLVTDFRRQQEKGDQAGSAGTLASIAATLTEQALIEQHQPDVLRGEAAKRSQGIATAAAATSRATQGKIDALRRAWDSAGPTRNRRRPSSWATTPEVQALWPDPEAKGRKRAIAAFIRKHAAAIFRGEV